MENKIFQEKYEQYRSRLEQYLEDLAQIPSCPQRCVYEAMRYSLMAGGKRIRPILLLAVAEYLQVELEESLPYAAALEMIHTYSLIHDDLPSMDNDDLRRGKPTNHIVYGEAMAILAGDALLTGAFSLTTDAILQGPASQMPNAVSAQKILADAAGAEGMIAGQVVDMESENRMISGEELYFMHRCKTGALIQAACLIPAALAGKMQQEEAKEDICQVLHRLGQSIGLGFQLKDDILDVESSETILGKPIGSDRQQGKSTFVTVYGLDKSKEMLGEYREEAIQCIFQLEGDTGFLKGMVEYLFGRDC